MFAPIRNIGDQVGVISKSGKIKVRTWYNSTVSSTVKDNTDVVYIPQTGTPVDDDIIVANTTANQTFPTTDFKEIKTNTTKVKTNWDGEVIPEGPWVDKELFCVGDACVTAGDAVIGTATLIIIILVVVAICMFISYRKRKEIAAGARRLSSYAVRASQKLRASMAGKRPEETGDPNFKANPKDITKDKKEQAMLGDMFAHQDGAKALAEDEESKAIENKDAPQF